MDALKDYCRTAIQKGSKSFSLAGRLLGADARDAAFGLYAWCRHCDDAIDENHGDAVSALKKLITQTEAAFAGEPVLDPAFRAFQIVVTRYKIPKIYAMELLDGMAMDTRGERYETLEDLLVYCYRVAGTVGLMMSHIMGLSDETALKNACDMGIAMQLTNIARDVKDDFERGRVYLPLAWLRNAGVATEKLMDPSNRQAVYSLVQRLLAEATRFYCSGDKGVYALSFSAACAIAAARNVYSEIGRQILSQGPRALERRTIISPLRKSTRVFRSVLGVLMSLPKRVRTPWHPKPINMIWRSSNICRS